MSLERNNVQVSDDLMRVLYPDGVVLIAPGGHGEGGGMSVWKFNAANGEQVLNAVPRSVHIPAGGEVRLPNGDKITGL
jgi:hypothetical protein